MMNYFPNVTWKMTPMIPSTSQRLNPAPKTSKCQTNLIINHQNNHQNNHQFPLQTLKPLRRMMTLISILETSQKRSRTKSTAPERISQKMISLTMTTSHVTRHILLHPVLHPTISETSTSIDKNSLNFGAGQSTSAIFAMSKILRAMDSSHARQYSYFGSKLCNSCRTC